MWCVHDIAVVRHACNMQHVCGCMLKHHRRYQGLIEREGMQLIQRRNKRCYYF